jgi:adenylate cyclase
LERRLTAILAADVVGYSRLMGEDEAGTLERLKSLRRELVQPKITERKGRIVKLMGDGLLAEFPSVVEAVQCAIDIQSSMSAREADVAEKRNIRLRIGVNLGDIIVEGLDIYGDGVNVAARLEGLAEPSGICISGKVYEEVRDRLEVPFEDMGELEVKNIDRPVRVWRWSPENSHEAPRPRREFDLPMKVDKISIAVLPFNNMSGDPDQEYFSDGITENIITDLSRFRDLFVMARNSTFAYKGKGIVVQDVSRELGARYILEGSVQKSADRVRITAQLIDGETGGHLWAERYDRQLEDLFAVQDEVTERIVGTLASGWGGRLRKAWQNRAERKGTENYQAFDCFMRGIDTINFTKEDNRRGGELFEEAIGLDPNYAKAYAKLAWVHIIDAIYGWSSDYNGSMAKGLEFANKCVETDDEESWGHWALAGHYYYTMRHDLALSKFERAIELNPNDAEVLTDLGLCLSYAGRAKEGLESALKAIRINAHCPEWFLMQLGQIYHDARQYEDAVSTFESLRTLETVLTRLYLAASYAALGQSIKAEEAIARVLELDPLAKLEKWASVKFAPYADPNDLAHFRENLRKAGLPS